MIRLLAYPIAQQVDQVRFRVLRQEVETGKFQPFDWQICQTIVRKRRGQIARSSGGMLSVDAEGLRGILRFYRDVEGDAVVVYDAALHAHATVCGALRAMLGYVPGISSC